MTPPDLRSVRGDLVSSDLADALTGIDAIALSELSAAALMDRCENKFLLLASALPAVLRQLAPHDRVLTMQGQTVSPYRSLYLDTPDFTLYYAHYNGRSHRYKVRFRSYEQSQITFLEAKERQTNGRTGKACAPEAAPVFPLQPTSQALLEQVPTEDQALEPKLWVNCHRITLVGRAHPERLTLDLGLEFQRPGDSHVRQVGDVVIVELKRASLRQPSPFVTYVRAQGHRETRLSKYGVGCSLLYPLRSNASKPQHLALVQLLGTG